MNYTRLIRYAELMDLRLKYTRISPLLVNKFQWMTTTNSITKTVADMYVRGKSEACIRLYLNNIYRILEYNENLIDQNRSTVHAL